MEGKPVRRKSKSPSINKKEAEKPRHFSESSQQSKELLHSQPHAPSPPGLVFWVALAASQAIGIACIGLITHWCKLYGGFEWTGNPDLQFYFHPVFMVLGLIFFYGDAMIIYRVLYFLPKNALKIIHACIHLCAIISSIIGLVAVLEYHRKTNKPDFYSLHSWIGIGTFGLFCFQYIGGFVTFLYPGLPLSVRAKAMPFHTFFGSGLFILAIAAAQTGLTEKLLWTSGYTAATFHEQALIGNIVGILLVLFGFLIMFLTTHGAYKRKPLPSEIARPSVN